MLIFWINLWVLMGSLFVRAVLMEFKFLKPRRKMRSAVAPVAVDLVALAQKVMGDITPEIERGEEQGIEEWNKERGNQDWELAKDFKWLPDGWCSFSATSLSPLDRDMGLRARHTDEYKVSYREAYAIGKGWKKPTSLYRPGGMGSEIDDGPVGAYFRRMAIAQLALTSGAQSINEKRRGTGLTRYPTYHDEFPVYKQILIPVLEVDGTITNYRFENGKNVEITPWGTIRDQILLTDDESSVFLAAADQQQKQNEMRPAGARSEYMTSHILDPIRKQCR